MSERPEKTFVAESSAVVPVPNVFAPTLVFVVLYETKTVLAAKLNTELTERVVDVAETLRAVIW